MKKCSTDKGAKASIRELSLQAHRDALDTLLAKAALGELSNGELLALLDKAGKYGIGVKTEISVENAQFASLVVEVALQHMPEENWGAFRSAVKSVLGGEE